ncbi:MAG: hypothetical protein JNM93_08540 [Bacteriovoracaceae bacterium]|nr:hypothetical protein [Bacteriovoracaceae bacterium]
MKASLLNTIPVSGSFTEVNFGTSEDNNLVWILFEDELSEPWIGKFSSGRSGKSKVECVLDELFFVIANGQGYFIDAKLRKVLTKSKDDTLYSFVVVKPNNQIIATDGLCLIALSKDGTDWSTERFSLDGVIFDTVTSDEILGRYFFLDDNEKDWPKFKFSIQKRNFELERPIPPELLGSTKPKKSWWQFWK